MSRFEPLDLPAPDGARRSAPRSAVAHAQLLGQEGARRGLREGETAIRRARTAYLSAEWSGRDDRRPEAGLLVRGRL